MAKYPAEQVRILFKLRSRLAEKGYTIVEPKKSKHKAEFIAIKLQQGIRGGKPVYDVEKVLLCRLYRGRARIQHFEKWHRLGSFARKDLEKSFNSSICFANKAFNPTRYGNNRILHELILKDSLVTII